MAAGAGVHVVYRKTNGLFYVAAASTLKLPTQVGYRPNAANYSNGAFPEFFHGFYIGEHGLDAGIFYGADENGRTGFILFMNAFPKTYTLKWHSQPVMSDVREGETIQLITSFVNGYLKTDCTTVSGRVLDSYSLPLTASGYRTLSSGSEMHREMTLAINRDSSGRAEVPAPAYFKDAEFSRTTLTTKSGGYVKLDDQISNTDDSGKWDDKYPDRSTYAGDGNEVTEEGYVKDIGEGTLDKEGHPL